MLAAQAKQLLDGEPEGVAEALEVVSGFDDVLVHGLARVGEAQSGALAAFAVALAACPLRDRVAEAVEKVRAGSIGDEHLMALAGGRTALLGAVHDAYLGRLDAALGRTRATWESTGSNVEKESGNLLAGCRSWLSELAITGWRGVGHDLVEACGNAIQAAYAEPKLRRLAVLLDGLASELRAASPTATMEHVPVRRWADLWSRAMLLSQPGALSAPAATTEVSGRLLILGVDIHEHETAVQFQVHGVLEEAGAQPRLVRASISAGKTNTVSGLPLWRLLLGYPQMLKGLADHSVLELSAMPLLPSGDLVWLDDRAAATPEAADPFATARVLLAVAVAPPVPPLQRHPVRIAEPVLLEGQVLEGGSIEGGSIELDPGRLPSCGPLTPELVKSASSCIGLLRWDAGRWHVQPIAVQTLVKKKPVTVHNGQWALGHPDPKVAKASSGAGDTVAILRERAGRLLRK
ncbi:MAG TPA: hypothetical protein VF062_24435 [Candidatus Limnocylindrales bacterium]